MIPSALWMHGLAGAARSLESQAKWSAHLHKPSSQVENEDATCMQVLHRRRQVCFGVRAACICGLGPRSWLLPGHELFGRLAAVLAAQPSRCLWGTGGRHAGAGPARAVQARPCHAAGISTNPPPRAWGSTHMRTHLWGCVENLQQACHATTGCCRLPTQPQRCVRVQCQPQALGLASDQYAHHSILEALVSTICMTDMKLRPCKTRHTGAETGHGNAIPARRCIWLSSQALGGCCLGTLWWTAMFENADVDIERTHPGGMRR